MIGAQFHLLFFPFFLVFPKLPQRRAAPFSGFLEKTQN
jgi:hypothetical protein